MGSPESCMRGLPVFNGFPSLCHACFSSYQSVWTLSVDSCPPSCSCPKDYINSYNHCTNSLCKPYAFVVNPLSVNKHDNVYTKNMACSQIAMFLDRIHKTANYRFFEEILQTDSALHLVDHS